MKEDGNKCVLYLMNFQASDAGEYEVIFPGDPDDNEHFQVSSGGIEARLKVFILFLAAIISNQIKEIKEIKEVSSGDIEAGLIVFISFLAIILPVIGFIGGFLFSERDIFRRRN